MDATWLILPVVICLSQRLSHACDSGPTMVVTGDGELGVRFRRGSLRNGYHIQGRQQARKLPNPDTGSWTLGWVDRSASGVHRSGRPFCRRCAPALTGRVVPPGSADVAFRTPLAPYEKSKSLGSGGSMVARLKLKGIDGRAPPGVEPAA
ncbi:hypothetical protein VNO80_35163 [Phaseolus coccineus]|uniref:Uncharacterized protein n=1 Tax=Phaseolus coccineus TaxID=3886 RepID=A0AAN9KRH5_PHACN